MPVIGRDAIRYQSYRHAHTRLRQHTFKGRIVALVLEERPAGIRTIQHVIDEVAGCRA